VLRYGVLGASLFAIAAIGLGCAATQANRGVEVVTSGAESSFEPTHCGGVASTFSSRIVRLDEFGHTIPVAGATFTYRRTDGAVVTVPIVVDVNGRFDERVTIMGPIYTFKSSGLELASNADEYALQLHLQAPGCAGTDVTIGRNWEDHDVVLRCSEPH
jgi:hypothetical protein